LSLRTSILAVAAAGAVLWAAGGAALQPASEAPGHTYKEVELPSGNLRYALVTPPDFEPGGIYPVLLALPPGSQEERMVEAGLAQYWEEEAIRRGWIVVSPVEPGSQSLFRDTEGTIGPLLDHLAATYKIEGGRVHVAGPSNGGRLAFRVATAMPEEVASVLVLPGYPPQRTDFKLLGNLAGKQVTMYVGEKDEPWLDESERTLRRLLELGVNASLHVLPEQEHLLRVDPATLFDALDEARSHQSPEEAEAAAVLDSLHAAAADADFERYFDLFAPGAVFLGTDASERWTVDQFKAYARPHFENGEGWTYTVKERHISLSEDGAVAWFDEALENAKLGACRGSGVLVRRDGTWKVAQYNLSIPIPNEVSDRVVRVIKAHKPRR
jgi:dienelactone hydrolase